MSEKYAVVITTINHPTRAVVEIARDAPRLGADFVLIGDEKSPADFRQEGARYLDIAAQRAAGFRYGEIAPTRHYARKNVGYLAAIAAGATVIVETDDDNIPRDEFWEPRSAEVPARVLDGGGWANVYALFADQLIWPRGLPLDRVQDPRPVLDAGSDRAVYCPIQQGLADDNPDVDAIYRLILPLPVVFKPEPPVALVNGAWCPFNSQNTTFFQEAFPLLYLPYHCSFRMTDIWRSFVAQRIAFVNGWGMLFHKATVFQERNEHSLMRDFEEEVPGYLHNERIRQALEALPLSPGVQNIPDALRACYERLVAMELVGAGELALLDAWLTDLAEIPRPAPRRAVGSASASGDFR